jgi:hypothetical protein
MNNMLKNEMRKKQSAREYGHTLDMMLSLVLIERCWDDSLLLETGVLT